MTAPLTAAPAPANQWEQHAICRGMDPAVFFPTHQGDVAEAVAVCRTCPVQRECYETASARAEEAGVWGGQVWDRQLVRRLRRRAAKTGSSNETVSCDSGSQDRYR